MAYANKVIKNQKTGQQIRFIKTSRDTEGKYLVMESTMEPYSKEPISHYHPRQDEDFCVLEGRLSVRLNGRVYILEPGDRLHIPRKTVHSMWNSSNEKAVVSWIVSPALETEYLLETGMGVSNEGKTNDDGMPSLLQSALIINRYDAVYRLARPSYFIQKILFSTLAPFAYLMGYRPVYKKFLD